MRLSAVDLACRRGGRDVFAGVSFSIASGEGLTVSGPNGAGKSSLLRMVVGLLRVADGRIVLEGGDPELTVGLHTLADLPAAYLSAGQRRRLSIARLVAVRRPIWLLDEPSSTLDAAAQARLTELMRAHLAGGGMILAASHGALGIAGAQELRLDQIAPPEGRGDGKQ
jgi:heme exporter protein A